MLNIVNSNSMFNTQTEASSLSSEMKYSSSLQLQFISEFSQRDRVVQRVLFFFNFLFKFQISFHLARVQNARKFPARCQCSSPMAAAMDTVSVFSILNAISPVFLSFRPCTWFERVSMLVILLNCVTLGMFQPCVDDKCEKNRCKILQVKCVRWGLGQLAIRSQIKFATTHQ